MRLPKSTKIAGLSDAGGLILEDVEQAGQGTTAARISIKSDESEL